MSNVGQIYKIRVLIDFVTDLYDLQRAPAQCDERGLCWMLRMQGGGLVVPLNYRCVE